MKRLLSLVALSLFLTAAVSAQQVVTKENLESNHTGMLADSKNNDGKPIYYKFEYVSTDKAAYKWDDDGATRGSIKYKLHIYNDAAMNDLVISLPVKMRNLITTYYVDVVFNKKDYEDADRREKSAQMIFKKDVKWARTKFVPHAGCQREDGNWERKDRVESYEDLLQYLIQQLDSNVMWECYL
jgi:hypothetical protein